MATYKQASLLFNLQLWQRLAEVQHPLNSKNVYINRISAHHQIIIIIITMLLRVTVNISTVKIIWWKLLAVFISTGSVKEPIIQHVNRFSERLLWFRLEPMQPVMSSHAPTNILETIRDRALVVQRTINRKRLMGNQIVTWLMTSPQKVKSCPQYTSSKMSWKQMEIVCCEAVWPAILVTAWLLVILLSYFVYIILKHIKLWETITQTLNNWEVLCHSPLSIIPLQPTHTKSHGHRYDASILPERLCKAQRGRQVDWNWDIRLQLLSISITDA